MSEIQGPSSWWIRDAEGSAEKPIDFAEIVQGIKAGKIPPTSQVMSYATLGTGGKWRAVGEVDFLLSAALRRASASDGGEQVEQAPRFALLPFVSSVLCGVGWLVAVIGVIYAFAAGVVEPNRAGHQFGAEDVVDLIVGAAFLLFGLCSVALGELLGVLFAIEQNTRRMADAADVSRQGADLVKTELVVGKEATE